jgi:hypothetical protein
MTRKGSLDLGAQEPLRAIQAAQAILGRFTLEHSAGIVGLVTAGNRLEELEELSSFTLAPLFEIRGVLSTLGSWRRQVANLIFDSDATAVSLALHFPWGGIAIDYRISWSDSDKRRVTFSFRRLGAPGTQEGGYISKALPTILDELGAHPGEFVQDTAEGDRVWNESTTGVEAVAVATVANTTRLMPVLEAVTSQMEPPQTVHLILSGELRLVQRLATIGAVAKCDDGCSSEFGYGFGDLAPSKSTVAPSRLEELVRLMAHQTATSQIVSFRDFSWQWQEPGQRAKNAVRWESRQGGPAVVAIEWGGRVSPLILEEMKTVVKDAIVYRGLL